MTLEDLITICNEDGVLIDPNELKRLAEGIKRRAGPGATVADAVATYCMAWKEKYGSRPDLLGKDKALLKGLVRDLGVARAVALIRHYLTMDNPWFLQRQHDVTTLHMRHLIVSADMEGRTVVTQTQAKQGEKSATARSQLQRIKEGKL